MTHLSLSKNGVFEFKFGFFVFDVIINTDNLSANQVIDVTTETVRKLL